MVMKTKNVKVSGFTLVELIVVIAVIGILTAILVPSMLGYTRRAKFAAANANAKSLLNAGMLACRESDVTKPIPPGIYTKEGGQSLDNNTLENPVMNQYIAQHFKGADTCVWGIRVEEDIVTGAFVAASESTAYIGTYPHPNDTPKKLTDTTFAKVLDYAESGLWS